VCINISLLLLKASLRSSSLKDTYPFYKQAVEGGAVMRTKKKHVQSSSHEINAG